MISSYPVSWTRLILTSVPTPLIWQKVERTYLILESEVSIQELFYPARHKKQTGKRYFYTVVLEFLSKAGIMGQ